MAIKCIDVWAVWDMATVDVVEVQGVESGERGGLEKWCAFCILAARCLNVKRGTVILVNGEECESGLHGVSCSIVPVEAHRDKTTKARR